jgi:uncharacterized protein YecE (DUF72 family)
VRCDINRTGTAGWPIPAALADSFPTKPSNLERYAACLNAVEINSSFYRRHLPRTYARWAASVPDDFRFAVKLPKTITHDGRLAREGVELDDFLSEIAMLGPRLGPVLVQLPPSLAFDMEVAGRFFRRLRGSFAGMVACEPRHPSWFNPEAEHLLAEMNVARVAADPACVPAAGVPGGAPGFLYVRLHGSPRMYYSPYSASYLAELAERLRANPSAEVWCIFDNTASGAATANALAFTELMAR